MLPDVQMSKPEIPIKLNRVGAKGIKKLVLVGRKGRRPIVLVSTFDVFVDLNERLKGANLSRNFEAIDEVLENLTSRTVTWIEELTEEIAKELLNRHEYADRAEVTMSAELIMKKKTPITKNRTQELVKIFSNSSIVRGSKINTWIGVEVWGTTACPCAQELLKAKIVDRLMNCGFSGSDVEKVLKSVVLPTHNQRSKAEVWIQLKGFKISLESLIEIAKAGMSCEIYELLKREDEAEVVERIHKNPMFVEDSVRKMVEKAICVLKNVPDETMIILRQENEESIHQHNVFAEIVASIGELRKKLI